MKAFQEYVYKSIKDKLFEVDKHVLEDIYVISLYLSDVLDDPRRPMLTLGFNTRTQFKTSIGMASDELEAKWNYAFWLQNSLLIIGDNYGANEDDGAKIKQWILDTDMNTNDDEAITDKFVDLCVNVVKQLHKKKIIKKIFKRHIPIIIHELEYYDKIAEQNVDANGKGLIKEFVDWIYNYK